MTFQFKTLLCRPLLHISELSLTTFLFKTLLHISKPWLKSQLQTLQDFTAHFWTATGHFSIKDITSQDFTTHLKPATDGFSIQDLSIHTLRCKTLWHCWKFHSLRYFARFYYTFLNCNWTLFYSEFTAHFETASGDFSRHYFARLY